MNECRECGFPVEAEDRFCGNCRTEITMNIARETNAKEEPASAGQGKIILPQNHSAQKADVVRVEANAARVLLEGSVLPLEFRIHSQKELSAVALSVRSTHGIAICNRVVPFVSGANLYLDLAVPRGCSGTLGFEVSLKYRLDGKAVELHGSCRHEVCPAAGDGNITVDIKQGHAGDIQVSGLTELAAMNDKRTLLHELNAIESQWENLPLQGILEKAIEPKGHESVVVEIPSGPLLLFSGSCLTFGRARENEIITRITQLPRALLNSTNPNNPNRFISSRHGWLHRTEEGVFVVDGDMVGGKPSGGGTFLDGQRITREKLPAHSVELSLCGEDVSLPTIYSLRITASEEGIVLRPHEPRSGTFLWLFGRLDFEGSTYEHRSNGFYRDGKLLTG